MDESGWLLCSWRRHAGSIVAKMLGFVGTKRHDAPFYRLEPPLPSLETILKGLIRLTREDTIIVAPLSLRFVVAVGFCPAA